MKKKTLTAHILILALFLLSTFSAVQGQIVTPSLDPSTKVRTAAPSSWRYLTTNNSPDKNRTVTAALLSQAGKGEYTPENKSWYLSKSGGIILVKLGDFNLEAFSEATLKEIEQLGASSKENKISESQYNLAYRLDSLSIGGSQRVYAKTKGTQEESVKTGQSLSVTYQLGSAFFVGLGNEIVNRTQNGVANNDWVNATWGFAVLSGDPKGTQFRLESSYLNSDQTTGRESGKTTQYHRKTSVLNQAAELKIGNLVLSFFRQNRVEAPLSDSTTEIVKEKLKFGALQVDIEGLIIGGYWVKELKTENNKTEVTISTRAHLGYNF